MVKTTAIPYAVLAAFASVVALAQLPEVPPKPQPPSSVAQAVQDSTITAKVKDAISSDPELKQVEATVETNEAVVTINGIADSREQVSRMIAVARAIAGVKSVVNLMAVRAS